MTGAGHIERTEAARFLREARAARGEARREAAGWAAAVMPERRVAARLLVDSLLEADQLDEAGAVLERARQHLPDDASLLLRQARCLMAVGRLPDAWRAARAAARLRPHHVGTLLTAAAIARETDSPAKCARLLERATRLRSQTPSVIDALVSARLAVDDVVGARAAMVRYPAVSLATRGRVLLAEGRTTEAIELLGDAPRDERAAEADERTAVLLEAIECAGLAERLRSAIARVSPELPAAYSTAISARMALGELDEAIAMASALAERPAWRRRALHQLTVAAALAGRIAVARGALARLRAMSGAVDHEALVTAWRRAIAGRIANRQVSPRRAGADEGQGVLATLLERAVGVCDRKIAGAGREPRPDLIAIRAAAVTALGRAAADAVLVPVKPGRPPLRRRQTDGRSPAGSSP